MNESFFTWMSLTTNLSDASIYKYKRAVVSVSNDMIENHIINKELFNMNLFELDISIMNILSDISFVEKNKKGNNMYSCALKYFRLFTLANSDIDFCYDSAVEEIKVAPKIKETEKESIIKSRIGQGIFRKMLIKKYDGKCLVTGIDIESALVASHIKPWSVSDNYERLSTENGFLLSASIDRLFDSGLITFDNKGKIYISNYVGEANKNKLNINCDIVVDLKGSRELFSNLEYHRDVIFVR